MPSPEEDARGGTATIVFELCVAQAVGEQLVWKVSRESIGEPCSHWPIWLIARLYPSQQTVVQLHASYLVLTRVSMAFMSGGYVDS